MAMICVGVNKEHGRDTFEYIDTDDLDQPEYYYYHKAKRLRLDGFAKKILLGHLTAEMIENDERYAKLAD